MKGEFGIAVHALVYLNHKQDRRDSRDIAENVCTNPARIRKVLAHLRKAGMVQAQEGAEGGFRFVLDAGKVTLKDVLNAVEVCLIEPAWRSGDPNMECLIASGMADVMDEVYDKLNRDCGEKLGEITIADIDRKIFGGIET